VTIVGFNFTKISAEKTSPIKGKININNKAVIKDVTEADLSLGKDKQKGVKFIFNYSAIYEPKVGKVELEGDLLYLDEDAAVKEILDGWKKDKKVPQNVMGSVLNAVLTKSNIQALIVSRDVALPPSVQLPKVNIKQ